MILILIQSLLQLSDSDAGFVRQIHQLLSHLLLQNIQIEI
jgi:hypothetical protein